VRAAVSRIFSSAGCLLSDVSVPAGRQFCSPEQSLNRPPGVASVCLSVWLCRQQQPHAVLELHQPLLLQLPQRAARQGGHPLWAQGLQAALPRLTERRGPRRGRLTAQKPVPRSARNFANLDTAPPRVFTLLPLSCFIHPARLVSPQPESVGPQVELPRAACTPAVLVGAATVTFFSLSA
jgi:hypothetical protein